MTRFSHLEVKCMELIGTAIVLVVLAVAFGLMKWGQGEDKSYDKGYKDPGHKDPHHKG